ncbi:uncharacterized protein A1O9_00407 [Exophiala aquamarina CBS 119918]|uniref:HNH nuclease domain-containing protein n=1 Tax=Exophiala aquamarina CBS 119918 TaxID=1182545 RepID=A0A072Q3F6_9EURO|nr:uncharacterized protein A1O9_00407 [Exophiala aquamarina CBS 119918]KEF62435.1 hypothetical protein A1O9_00407 [Exophiala aquamarina CBS 119918]
MQDWLPYKTCTAAHILPYSFPDHLFDHIFVADAEDKRNLKERTMTVANGIYLYKPVEQAFDRGDLIITPHYCSSNGRTELRAHLLHEGMKSAKIGDDSTLLWKDIDNRMLQFQNANRPAKRF